MKPEQVIPLKRKSHHFFRSSPAAYQPPTLEPQPRPSSDPRSLNTPGSHQQPPRSAPSQPYSRSNSEDPRTGTSQPYSRSNSGDPRSAPSQPFSRSISGDPRNAPSQTYSRSNSGDPRMPEPRARFTPEPRTSRTSFTRKDSALISYQDVFFDFNFISSMVFLSEVKYLIDTVCLSSLTKCYIASLQIGAILLGHIST